MTNRAKLAVLAVFAVALAGGTIALLATAEDQPGDLVRDDTHYVRKSEDAEAEVVVFTDYACELCAILDPTFERLAEEYEGRVDFALRHFPTPGSPSAVLAARAAEAAGLQGELDAMRRELFATFNDWAYDQGGHREHFVELAEELELDVDRFEADLDGEEVAARLERDREDGLALGIRLPPALFVDGGVVEPPSPQALTIAIERALGERD